MRSIREHPSPYRLKFWLSGQDPEPWVGAHLQGCAKCRELAEKLQNDPTEHPSSYRLRRYLSGIDANPEQVEEHLKTCPPCQETTARLKEERDELFERLPPDVFVQKVLARGDISPLPAPRRRFFRLKVSLATAVAVLALLFLLIPRDHHPPEKPAKPDIKYKGSSDDKPFHLTAVLVQKAYEYVPFHVTDFEKPFYIDTGEIVSAKLFVKQPGKYSIGVLQDDGQAFMMVENIWLRRGLYKDAVPLEVDDKPTPGYLIAGLADVVKRAIRDRKTDIPGLQRIRILGKRPRKDNNNQ